MGTTRSSVALACALGVAGGVSVAAGAPDAPPVRFQSPTGNIRCELGPSNSGNPAAACVTLAPRQGAIVEAGHRGRAVAFDAVGPLSKARMLRYGFSIRGFGFRCVSAESGMTCLDGRTGRGFAIAREGVVTLPRSGGGSTAPKPSGRCNPNYAGVCLPLNHDVDCPDITARDFRVVGVDVYHLDADGDGIACESH